MRKLSIRFKLFLAFVIISTFTGVLVGAGSFQNAKEIIFEKQRNNLVSLRKIKKEQIKAAVSRYSAQINYLALSAMVIDGVQNLTDAYKKIDLDSNKKFLDGCSAALNGYSYKEYIKSNDGNLGYFTFSRYQATDDISTILQCKYIVNADISKPFQLNTEEFDNVFDDLDKKLKTYNDKIGFEDILIINAEGIIVYSNQYNLDFATNILMGPWLRTELNKIFTTEKNTMHKGGSRIHDLSFYPPMENEAVAFITSPIYDEHYNFIGILVGVLGSTQFDKMVSNNYNWEVDGLAKTGESYIIGKDNYMRTNSRYVVENKTSYLEMLKKAAYGTDTIAGINAANSTILLQKIDTAVANAVSKGDVGVVTGMDYRNIATITAYTPLDLPDLQWGLIVEIDLAEASKPVDILWSSIIWSMFFVVLVIIIITLLVSGAIVKPINKLVKTVSDFTQGNYDIRLKDQSWDEIGELSRSFDHMANTLQQRATEIRKTNLDLTAEIEERKNAEDKLEKEMTFITSVLDSQILLLMVTDSKHNIIRVNKMFEVLTGYVHNEINNVSIFSTDYCFVTADKVLVSNESEQLTAELISKGGKVLIINWVISKMIDREQDSSELLVWTGVDVTGQKEVEKQLEDNAKMLQSLTKNALDGIFIINEENQIILWNESAERMFGYNNQEIKGMNYSILFSESIDLFKTPEDETGSILEVSALGKYKHKFPVEISASRMKIQKNQNTMFIIRDVSSRKQRELELKDAFEKAKIAEKAKTEFLANMSHEIRTPLNGILGFLELLSQTHLDTTQNDYLKIINGSANSLLGIINEILDFSKIESGQMVLDEVEFDTYSQFEHILELFIARANEKNQELILDMDFSLPDKMVGDPLRIRQIVSNLLSNAIKFTQEKGRIMLNVNLIDTTDEEYTLRIAVEDNGIGIDTDKQKSIFKAFSQADNSVTRKYGGTGLGLTISARLAKLMRSRLELESSVNKGSRFWFDIKLKAGPNAQPLKTFDNLKVAVIEDGAIQEKILKKYLKGLKCNVLNLSDWRDIRNHPDLSIIFINYENRTNAEIIEIANTIPGSARIIMANDSLRESVKDIEHIVSKVIFHPLGLSKLLSALNDIIYGIESKIDDVSDDIQFEGKVLVAEDNPVNQQLIKILFGKIGLDFDIAENGEMAVEYAKSREYDMIFMDIHMPVMDGVSATKNYIEWANANSVAPIPVIALTANVIEEDQKIYKKAGMSGFLAKPIVVPELLKVLNEYLQVKQLHSDENEVKSIAVTLGINGEVLKTFLNDFIESAKKKAIDMDLLLKDNNMDEFFRNVADLHGSTASFGLKKLLEILENIELCKINKNNDVQQLFSNLKLEVDRLAEVFKRYEYV